MTGGGLDDLRRELRGLADPQAAEVSARFFRTAPGQYGEGDRFLGIRVPALRKMAKRYRDLPLSDVAELLRSPFHEERFVALLLLVHRYGRGDPATRDEVYRLYLDHTAHIDSWDLVDTSAEHVVGAHLFGGDTAELTRLAESDSVWERRIAILATLHFIKRGRFDETLRIARLLLHDDHDLIHKAVGWMLREVGNRDRETEDRFLREHFSSMPRTALRYAIEKHPEELRQRYLRGQP